MTNCIHLEPVDRVPLDARVYDYDELPDEIQHGLATLGADCCLGSVDDGPTVDEYVRFTEYYRVRRR